MAALDLGDIADFPFIEPPAPRMIADGYGLLQELNAVDEARRLTPIGVQLAKLPLDPKLSRMLLAAQEQHCVTEILIIASALSVQDPRVRPMGSEGAADDKHKYFVGEHSDFMGLLKVWAFYEESLKHKKSQRKLVEECHAHFLSYLRLREWHDLHGQLAAQAAELGLRLNPSPATYEQIHRALLAGLIANIGVKADEGYYQGAREIKFHIHPGSSLFKKGAKWIMAAELTETGKLYARSVAKIEPEWVEQVGAHLIKRHYFDPHWEKSAAQVVAFERITLYGLTLTPRRRVHFGAIDVSQSREIFIRAALAAGEYETKAKFFLHNQALVEEIRELEHKSRRPDVLVDEEKMFVFFDARIPADIVNGHGFEKWRREAERENPKLLCMQRDDLMRHGAEDVTETLFPDTLQVDDGSCALSYRFEPGHALDGVTLTLPLHLLNRVQETRCDWLVPGMIRDKITGLIKCLPKPIRNRLLPHAEFVTAFLSSGATMGEGDLPTALAAFIKKKYTLAISSDDWRLGELPQHLRMQFRVIDEAGKELASSRDLSELRQKLGQTAQMTFAKAADTIDNLHERVGLTQWDCGDLPEKVSFNRNGAQLTGYPALVDDGESVSIRLFDTADAAALSLRSGVRRLLWLALKEQMKQLEKSIPGFNQIAMQARGVMNADELRDDCLACIADRAFIGEDELPRSEKEFSKQRDRAKTRLPAVAQATSRLAAEIFTEFHTLQARLPGKYPAPLVSDLREQLAHLVYKRFLAATPWNHLQHLPRYLKAMQRRLDKFRENAERDTKHTASIKEWWQHYQTRLEKHRKGGISDPKLAEFRWLLEELRVSLFAQELKTPFPISYKRLEKAWGEVRA